MLSTFQSEYNPALDSSRLMITRHSLSVFILIALAIFTAGCMSYIRDSSYNMRFSLNETGEALEGDVYNNDNLLGYATNGTLVTPIEKLRPGLISLNGTYQNQGFEFFFEFPKDSLNYSGINFSLSRRDLNKAIFNASAIDIQKIEREIFDGINEIRKVSGTNILQWNSKIAQVGRNYSKTLSIEGFAHKDLEGRNVGDRLKENKIFYTIVAEDLYMLEGLSDESNMSKTIVQGWMKSPGHRSPIVDRDGLFSDGGAGVYCEKKSCYAVMVFVGLEHDQSIKLDPGYLTFFYVYDPSYPFDFDVPVSIDITSTGYIDIYLVPDREQYNDFLKNSNINSIYEIKNVRTFTRSITARKGEGIIIQSDGGANVDAHLRYS
ncbi:MAG: CAP domain-containing protein [Candidatus Methanoperedens sp.]|nr:CAP domain-containing protein [Candidatus Methanoperedens sp.]